MSTKQITFQVRLTVEGGDVDPVYLADSIEEGILLYKQNAGLTRNEDDGYVTEVAVEPASLLCLNEVEIPVPEHGASLWFVRGRPTIAYPTKIATEAKARILYPGQDTNSNVYFKIFVREA